MSRNRGVGSTSSDGPPQVAFICAAPDVSSNSCSPASELNSDSGIMERSGVPGPMQLPPSELALLQALAQSQLSASSRESSMDGGADDETAERLFSVFSQDDRFVVVGKFVQALQSTGLQKDDPRLKEMIKAIAELRVSSTTSLQDELHETGLKLDKQTFLRVVNENICLIGAAFRNEFVIPEWAEFCKDIEFIFADCKRNCSGEVASYIPQLKRYDPNLWGLSVCSVDGQRVHYGDHTVPFCLQSTSKPLTYALVLHDLAAETVHQHVGQEPSGRSFNELSLNPQNRPHNPMINAGAICTASLLKTSDNLADRYDYAFKNFKRLAGGGYLGVSMQTFLSERTTADRNYALAYFMQENKCFPPNAKLDDTLELYFQLCSIEVTTESASVIAATLANGGICPITGEKILDAEAVRNTLSLMHSCGMYDYSGQFAFKVGLPAKSGVSGLILLVVPNVMGIAMWSPPLDPLGNSCRGLQFCSDLVSTFNFHNYDNLKHTLRKKDPRVRQMDVQATTVVNLLFGAAHGDVSAMRRFHLRGMNMGDADYDGRTALHLAAAEGQLEVVKFLIEKCKVDPYPRDRWDFLPIDDAKRYHHKEIEHYLQAIGPPSTTHTEDRKP